MRFELLDGFRGVAALMVLAFHVTLNASMREALPFGGLAVDFFFCLSGFVICHSYEDRLRNGLAFSDFMKLRLIRLYPMIFFGLLIGMAWLVARVVLEQQYHLLLPSIATFFVNAALLPSPFLLLGDDAAWPINGAHWSITFEVFANIAYATVLFRLGGRSLYALIAVCAFFLLAGILVRGSYDVGWRLHQFHLACIRTAFPFLAGVAVCRLRRKYLVDARIKQQYGFILICVLIGFLAMPGGLMPRVGFQSVFVVIVVPVLVLLGSCVRVDENYGGVCRFLGSISFPLYAVHQPILKVVNFARGGLAADAGADLFSAFVGAVTSIAVALLLLYWLDEPVKSFMRAILLKNGTRRMVHGRSA